MKGQNSFQRRGKEITKIILDFTGPPEMFDLSKEEVHAPIFLVNFFMRYKPKDVVAAEFIPFVAMIHENDFAFNGRIFDICRLRVEDALNYTYNTPIGDYYEYRSVRKDILRITLENSVIVLGSYKDRWKQELEQVRDYLKTEGYDAASLVSNKLMQCVYPQGYQS
jgi:GTP-dependent phosphoenolpyruvate carboxykinase